jgi:hypothetical protein
MCSEERHHGRRSASGALVPRRWRLHDHEGSPTSALLSLIAGCGRRPTFDGGSASPRRGEAMGGAEASSPLPPTSHARPSADPRSCYATLLFVGRQPADSKRRRRRMGRRGRDWGRGEEAGGLEEKGRGGGLEDGWTTRFWPRVVTVPEKAKTSATETSSLAASARWPRRQLGPIVMDSSRDAACVKCFDRIQWLLLKAGQKIYCRR